MSINGADRQHPSRVVVALSGGSDSALAAALLQAQGWAVTGLHFLLPSSPFQKRARVLSVERVGEHLNIPIDFVDLLEVFARRVVDPFEEAYRKGLTPNPCILCNERVKFEHLARYGDERAIPHVATGHYATIRMRSDGRAQLWRGSDRGKEQSYFLHRLKQAHLSRMILPLGNMTKVQARGLSVQMGLPTASEPESQEICFLPKNDYRLFLEERHGEGLRRKGDIVTRDGKKVGEHDGIYRYTIGQRHGLGIASPSPYYVMEIRPDVNQVVVGRKEEILTRVVRAVGFHWIEGRPSLQSLRVQAQVRYRHTAAPGRLEAITEQDVRFEFDAPQWAVTPGQALVCYDGDRVIGGGWIRKV